MVGRRSKALSIALSFMLAFSPLVGCASTSATSNSSAESESMEKGDVGSTDVTPELAGKTIDFNRQGTYTVSFTQDDLRAATSGTAQNEDMTKAAPDDEAVAIGDSSSSTQSEDGASASSVSPSSSVQATGSLDTLKQEDIQVIYQLVTVPQSTETTEAEATDEAAEADEKSLADAEESDRVEGVAVEAEDIKLEERTAQITEFTNANGTVTVGFSDPDAATNATDGYTIVIPSMNASVPMAVRFADHTLTTQTESIPAKDATHEVAIKVAEGSFEENVTPAMVTLDGSLAQMQVADAKASGDTLTLHLTGAPVLDYEVSGVYTEGEITVAAEAFQNGAQEHVALLPIEPVSASVDDDKLSYDNGKLSVPIDLNGMDASSISAADVKIEGMQVSDVKQDGDDRVIVSVQANDAATAVDTLSTADITVGDVSFSPSVSGAFFYVSDAYAEVGDGELKATIVLNAESGTFANNLSAEMVKLEDGLKDAKLQSVTRKDDTTAELSVIVPIAAPASTYAIAGYVSLASGALLDESGLSVSEKGDVVYIYTEDAGKMRESDSEDSVLDIINNKDEATTKKDAATNTTSTGTGGDEAFKKAEEDTTKKAAEAKKKALEAAKSRNKVIGAGFDFTIKAVGNIDKDAAKILTFGKKAFDIFAGATTGDYSSIFGNIMGILELGGIIPTAKEVTMADLKSDLDAIKDKMDAMRKDVKATNQMLEQKGWTDFDTNVRELETKADNVQGVFDMAARVAELRGIKAPEPGASNEQAVEYLAKLKDIIDEGANKKYDGFVRGQKNMDQLEISFDKVCSALSDPHDSNPLYYHDAYWSGFYNWDSQGYTQRLAFRTNVQFQIDRAFSYIYAWNRLDKPGNTSMEGTVSNYAKSLEQLKNRPAGVSADDIWRATRRPAYQKPFKVYSPSLGITVKKVINTNNLGVTDETISDEKINEFKSRLKKSLQNDLDLAGFVIIPFGYKGLGLRNAYHARSDISYDGSGTVITTRTNIALVLGWDGSLAAKESYKRTTVTGIKSSDSTEENYRYYWFERA